ncbi:MAG: N-acetylmuramoyl-L-alanine amidase, partial [Alphaproteobacteria bacterium]
MISFFQNSKFKKKNLATKVVVFTASILFATHASSNEIRDFRIATSSTATKIVFSTSGETSFNAFTLPNPPRLVIDVPKLKNTGLIKGKSGGFILNTRVGQHGSTHNRFVLDLSQNINLNKPTVFSKGNVKLFEFVLAVSPDNKFKEQAFNHQPQTYVSLPKPSSLGLPHVSKPKPVTTFPTPAVKPIKASFPTKQGTSFGVRGSSRKPVIIIDPGHGGKDPGAKSISGVEEKDLTLTFGAELASELIKSGNYRVFLTRNKDVYIPLRERTRLAEAVGGDLFISIHADSNTEAKARGASFYTLSDKASDKEAAAMAERENAAFLLHGKGHDPEETKVQAILNGLALRESMMQSRIMADQLTYNVSQIWPTRPRPHRRAGFAVLKSSKMPAVLLEMGYLTNKLDEQILMVPGYRLTLANGIKESIDSY